MKNNEINCSIVENLHISFFISLLKGDAYVYLTDRNEAYNIKNYILVPIWPVEGASDLCGFTTIL